MTKKGIVNWWPAPRLAAVPVGTVYIGGVENHYSTKAFLVIFCILYLIRIIGLDGGKGGYTGDKIIAGRSLNFPIKVNVV